MSACKTGCGEEVYTGGLQLLCRACDRAWISSPERARIDNAQDDRVAMAGLVDFVNRTRAERQNGAKP